MPLKLPHECVTSADQIRCFHVWSEQEGERGLGAEQIDCAFFRDGTAGLTNCATQPKQANVNPRLILKEAV